MLEFGKRNDGCAAQSEPRKVFLVGIIDKNICVGPIPAIAILDAEPIRQNGNMGLDRRFGRDLRRAVESRADREKGSGQ